MNIADILKKVVAGTTLSQEENDFLKSYKEGAGIPKERLDREIQAKKDAEAAKAEAEKAKKDAEERLKALEDSKLSDAEKAEKERKTREETNNRRIETLERQRDEAEAKAKSQDFRNNIQDLGKTHKVEDTETLQMFAEKEKLDFSDKDSVNAFIESQKTARPSLFGAEVKGGSGAKPGIGTGSVPLNKMPTTVSEKVAYIKEHGQEKYVELAEKESTDKVAEFEASKNTPTTK